MTATVGRRFRKGIRCFMGPDVECGTATNKAHGSTDLVAREKGHVAGSGLDPVAGLEDPPYHPEAEREEYADRGKAQAHAHIRNTEERPAKTRDQVDHRVEQRHRLPALRQHGDRVEGPAE